MSSFLRKIAFENCAHHKPASIARVLPPFNLSAALEDYLRLRKDEEAEDDEEVPPFNRRRKEEEAEDDEEESLFVYFESVMGASRFVASSSGELGSATNKKTGTADRAPDGHTDSTTRGGITTPESTERVLPPSPSPCRERATECAYHVDGVWRTNAHQMHIVLHQVCVCKQVRNMVRVGELAYILTPDSLCDLLFRIIFFNIQ